MSGEEGASVDFGVTSSEAPDATGVETEAAPVEQEGQSAPADQTPPSEVSEEPVVPAEPAAPAWEFNFGPKRFESQKDAEQFFSSWNGRIVRADRERDEALTALDEWDKWYGTNRERIDGALGRAKEGPAAEPEKAPEFVDAIKWDYVNELLEAGKTADAQKYVAWKTGELLKTQVDSAKTELRGEFEKGLGPIQEQHAMREMSTQVMLAAQSARHTDFPDVALFPEFQEDTETYDGEFVAKFGEAWRALEPQMALNPDLSGVELAYLRTKAGYVRSQKAEDAAQDAIDSEQQKFRQSTANRANAVGGGAAPTKTVPVKKKTLQDRLFEGMENTTRDEVFGTRK